MPMYIGYSSINANKPQTTNVPNGVDNGVGSTVRPLVSGKKFVEYDEQPIVQDLVNALNIPKGSKVGQPAYGTNIWDFIFEPNTSNTQQAIYEEIRRVAALDPRLIINTIKAYPAENGILIEVMLAVAPFNNPQQLSIFFNQNNNVAVLQ